MVVLVAMDQPTSVTTSDIYVNPTMFEINMQSSVPSSSHQSYITNDSVTYDSSIQAGDFRSVGGLKVNLDTLLVDDTPEAITVKCKFKNNADNSSGILFHIGGVNNTGEAFGIDIKNTQNLLYLYTWGNDHTYNLSDLNLRTHWNEIIAIYNSSASGNDRLQLYLNGVKRTPTSYATSNPTIYLALNKILYVGHRAESVHWSGYIKYIQILIPYVFNDSVIESDITQNFTNLTNKIDLTTFVNSSSVDNWSYYKIKFTYDGIVSELNAIDQSNKTFTFNMLLKQLKDNVTCKFEIIRESDNNVVYTSSNFTLVNQHVTVSNFNLTLYSLANNTILFQNNSQWIYMHESDSLNDTNIQHNKHVNVEHVEYVLHFIHGSSELQSLPNDNTKKIQLKVILTNKTNASDTISFTDSTEFIIHKVNNFSAFHTPTITPISNIHYFKEKKFKFDVSNNKYSFSFDVTPYDIIFKSRTAQPFFDINDKEQNNITITDLITEQNDVEIDILSYLFTHGKHTLRFYMKNELEGVKSIHDTSSVIQIIISSNIDIDLNVESNALVSCKVQ